MLGSTQKITKRRGFVMTGGGAKGLYEAGVIHAFHIAGMEFDVITGSSIGAMNSVFYAEYLLCKNQLEGAVRNKPEQVVEALDSLVKAFHHAWLSLPEKRIIDDSEAGPIGQLKDDLLEFDLNLSDLVDIGWWYSDPDRNSLPGPGVWPAFLRLGSEAFERLGGAGKLLNIFKFDQQGIFESAIRTYLRRFDLENSLIPPKDDKRIQDVFTEPISPLKAEHLSKGISMGSEKADQQYRLVDPGRTFKDYADAEIDVRLTRANYRTGRLEISTYLSLENFIRYMDKQAWRLDVDDPEKMPLGSFRLQLPGNPNAIRAAVASGRFPGVFIPYPFTEIYPQDGPENELLYQLLSSWFDDPKAEGQLRQAYQKVADGAELGDSWDDLLARWRKSSNIQEFFPHLDDTYIDGGAIDNTPSNSAIDATREWIEANKLSKRDVVLDLYIIFLHPEPKVDQLEDQDPAIYEVVDRTLEIQGAAKLSNDAVVVQTINSFGKRAEGLGQSLVTFMDSFQETFDQLDPDQKQTLEKALYELAKERGLRGYLGKGSDGVLDRLNDWAQKTIAEKLPLHVNEIKIHPEIMPLSTLQFTERLGYRQENAIEMLTMGCYDTLWSLRNHLEKTKKQLDEHDQQVLQMIGKWMDIPEWPKDKAQAALLRDNWACKRTACVFHETHCRHGAK
ncbi:patatin-like phospholipase family protein [Chloroflexota bacterium]